MKLRWFIALAVSLPLNVIAQAEIEEIVVTATKRAVDYYSMPSITLTKQADFLVQNIRLVNDSRSPDLRKKEIISTIENLLERAKSMKGMALAYGSGFLEPIDLDDVSLQMIEDRKKVDTNFVDIYAKVSFDPNRDPKEQIGELREFVAGTKKTGRTEIISLGDIGLSLIGPEQYRYEIIKKIAAENSRILEALQSDCEIAIGGLEGRIEWERTNVAELTLYIPYGLQVSGCTN